MSMRGMLPTEAIVIELATLGEENSWGEPEITYASEQVSRCLVAPASAGELAQAGFELKDRLIIQVHFPEAFTKSVANANLIVRGRKFKVLGDAWAWTQSPLEWIS